MWLGRREREEGVRHAAGDSEDDGFSEGMYLCIVCIMWFQRPCSGSMGAESYIHNIYNMIYTYMRVCTHIYMCM